VHAAAWNLAAVASGMASAADQVEQSCRDKARDVRALQADEVAGLGPEAVELMARVVPGQPSESELRQAAAYAGITMGERLLRLLPAEYSEALRADIAAWLTMGFVPVFEARKQVFDSACERARSECDGAWSELDGTLAQLELGTGQSTVDTQDAQDAQRSDSNGDDPGQVIGLAGGTGLLYAPPGGLSLAATAERDLLHRRSVPINELPVDEVAEPPNVDDLQPEKSDTMEPEAEPDAEQDELALLEELDELPETGSAPAPSESDDLLELIAEEDG
jgi:hypothetical protein